jgi:Ca-activated chloride channel family protein
MNGDNHHNGPEPWSDPAHEARIVAWVLGEASEFEIADLKRLIAENPELAAFKRRIEAVHGLLGEAAKPDAEPWALAPERRAALAGALGAAAPVAAVERPHVARRAARTALMMIAACIAGTLVVFKLVGPDAVRHAEMEKFTTYAPAAPEPGDFKMQAQRAAATEEGAAIAGLRSSDAEISEGMAAASPAVAAAPSAAMTKGMAASTPDEVPVPQVALALPAEGFGNSQDFGDGWGGSGAGAKDNRDAVRGQAVRGSGGSGGGGGGGPADPFSAPTPGAIAPTRQGDAPAAATLATEAAAEAPAGAPAGAPAIAEAGEGEGKGKGKGEAKKEALERDRDGQALSDEGRTEDKNKAANGLGISPADTDPEVAAPRRPVPPAMLDEVAAAAQPVSTFSLNVSDVSFQLAAAAIARGERPDPAGVRVEEFYNAFSYGDPAPATGEMVAIHVEQSAHPFAQQRNLVRVAMKTASQGRAAGQSLHLTVLVDTSGSMEREDRAATVQRAFASLAKLLGPDDVVSVVGFARQPRLLAEQVAGDQAGGLAELVARTPAEGGTNLEEALKLAGQLATRQFAAEAQNRIVLITDGAANLGDAVPEQLAALVVGFRQAGIAFDACGVGSAKTGDEMLEALARRGDGRYYHLGSAADADGGFAQKLAGAFRPAAENVKVQVRFNPERVGNYRLVGFEKHRLNEDDFRNDAVDAAELAADEAGVALYEVEVLADGDGEIGEVAVRFVDTASGQIVERSQPLRFSPAVAGFDQASASLQLAGTAAMVGEFLRGGAPGARVDLTTLTPVANHLRGAFANNARVATLLEMLARLSR